MVSRTSRGGIGLSTFARARRAAEELSCARPVIVTSEDKAALVLAAEYLTPERLAALRSLGPGVTLVLTPARAAHLRLRLYTEGGIAIAIDPAWEAPFIIALADPAQDLDHPLRGPLAAERKALPGAFLAGLRLARLAGTLPAIIAVPIADPAELALVAGFLTIDSAAIPDPAEPGDPGPLEAELVTQARLPMEGDVSAQLLAFRAKPSGLWGNGSETETHYALAIGVPDPATPLVRLHSECFTGDLLGSLKCDCGDQLRGAIQRIAEAGGGFLLYLRQEGRGIGLLNKLRAYHLQDQGVNTLEANERLGFAEDERSFRPAAYMLKALGVSKIRLLTNNPSKVEALKTAGIEVVERVGHSFPANPHNAHYLATKRAKSGHFL